MAFGKIILFAALCACGMAASSALDAQVSANPIRKVVTLLQNMQKEIESEGEKEKELFDKFMCYCSGGEQDLKTSADLSAMKIKELSARIKGETAEKTQLMQDLANHRTERKTAAEDLAAAQAIRTKEKGEYDSTAAEFKANVAALGGAIPAIEKGMGGSALMQLPGSDRLSNLLDNFPFSDGQDRKNLIAYIQENGDYVPASDQIVGILKSMEDQMNRDSQEADNNEAQAVKAFTDLSGSKNEEIQLATEAIASKTERSGTLAVSIAEGENDLEDTQEELADAQNFLHQLSQQCATKQEEWRSRTKVRLDEISAISEAIGMLNDDSALDLFKKAIPSSLMQTRRIAFLQRTEETKASALQKAQALLAHAASYGATPLKVLLYTVNSKIKLLHKSVLKMKNFDAVIKIVDDMVALLEKNQADDDHQKDWCREEFHKSAGEQTAAKRTLDKQSSEVDELVDAVTTLQGEIDTLNAGIKALDKSVAEATEQRKEEHTEYVSHVEMSNAALGLVEKAKNRLNKFYNPTIYKAAVVTPAPNSPYGFVQIRANHESRVAPPVAPDSFSGNAPEKNAQSGGVISLMKTIVNELEQDMQDAELEERDAQRDYTNTMKESQQSRSQDAKSITDKESAKAETNTKLTNMNEAKRSTQEDLGLVEKYIRELHGSCDFLVENYDSRKEARASESSALKDAKATLSGAH